MIRSCSLKPRQICEPAGVKQTISLQFFSIFELGGITKHLITGPAGNSEFCFPFELNVRMSDWFINKGIVWCTEDEMNFNSNSKISDVKFSANFYLISANNFEQCDKT